MSDDRRVFLLKQKLLIELPKIDQNYFEDRLYRDGIFSVAGVDEVGCGCLAGPVVAASVILPRDCEIEGINDSKKLSAKKLRPANTSTL